MAGPLTPYTGVSPNPFTQSQPEFDANVQTLVDFITELPDEINQFAVDLGTANTNSTSVTSNTIGTGSKAFTVDTGKAYFAGQSLTIARTAAPSNRMFAVVDTYNSGTGALVVTSQAFEGSGTFTDWTIMLGFNGILAEGQIPDDLITRTKLNNDALVPPTRQTVLSGPVDTSGLPSFGGATGSTTVTASGTLIATAANGFDANGAVNRIGSILNPSWTGLSTDGTMYLYLDIDADGTCTTGSGTLAPNYRWGGADVTTNGQFTFNIQEMQGKVGNGSVATQTYRVYVGEVTVAGSVVTAITWYALQGRYTSPSTATFAGLNVKASRNHNIGCPPSEFTSILENTTAELGFAIGDQLDFKSLQFSDGTQTTAPISANRLSMFFQTTTTNRAAVVNASGARALITLANWSYKLIANRGW